MPRKTLQLETLQILSRVCFSKLRRIFPSVFHPEFCSILLKSTSQSMSLNFQMISPFYNFFQRTYSVPHILRRGLWNTFGDFQTIELNDLKKSLKSMFLYVSYSLRRVINLYNTFFSLHFFHLISKKVSNKAMKLSWNIINSAFKSSVPGNSSSSSQTAERLGTTVGPLPFNFMVCS